MFSGFGGLGCCGFRVGTSGYPFIGLRGFRGSGLRGLGFTGLLGLDSGLGGFSGLLRVVGSERC